MPSGGSYVKNPGYDPNEIEQYSTVQAYTVSGNSRAIPSGATTVQGIYYKWNDSGFTGNGWMRTLPGSPTNIYEPRFTSDDDVERHIEQYGNLNAVFTYWAQHYDLDGWHNFYMAVYRNPDCMDVVHSAA